MVPVKNELGFFTYGSPSLSITRVLKITGVSRHRSVPQRVVSSAVRFENKVIKLINKRQSLHLIIILIITIRRE